MKTLAPNLLPERKMRELNRIIKAIRFVGDGRVHKIILFGSHARGDWVEDQYVSDGVTYEYMSDFDIMVIGDGKEFAEDLDMQMEIENLIDKAHFIKTWYSIIYEDINHVNEQLDRHQYFYCDVIKEGVLLYDSGKFKLNENPEPLSKEERLEIARENYESWTKKAFVSLRNVKANLDFFEENKEQEYLNEAAFNLHQAAERYLVSTSLVYTGYKPKTHDLEKLYQKAMALDPAFTVVFPRTTPEEKETFKLLRKAYTYARYEKEYKPSSEQIKRMQKAINALESVNRRSCEERLGNDLNKVK